MTVEAPPATSSTELDQRTAEAYRVDFPVLWVAIDWGEEHCRIPDGHLKGEPFVLYDWQLWCAANHYRVRPHARPKDTNGNPIRSQAFHNRRSQIVAPQKTGKGPGSAFFTSIEAVGPALFAGWAKGGEAWDCADHGCPCGWGYEYAPGEAMGRPWPTPLIQLSATSEDQVLDNVYGHLQNMIRTGPLGALMLIREGFIRLPNDGRIDVVTSRASSRLGNPSTFVVHDESGLYTKSNKLVNFAETQRRSLAGMSGRSLEQTNAWDPAEDSVAQRTFESLRTDIFRFYREPPPQLDYLNPAERRLIHEHVYAGSPHVDLDAIEAEAAELVEHDPQQAERFFGNRMVRGLGSWLVEGAWRDAVAG
jgi:hypothetical protein